MASDDSLRATPRGLPPHLRKNGAGNGMPESSSPETSASSGSGGGSGGGQQQQQWVTGLPQQPSLASGTGREGATAQKSGGQSSARRADENRKNVHDATMEVSSQKAQASSSSSAPRTKVMGGSNRDIGRPQPNGFNTQRPNANVNHVVYRPTVKTRQTPPKAMGGSNRDIAPHQSNGFTNQLPSGSVDHASYRPTMQTQQSPPASQALQKEGGRATPPPKALPPHQKPNGPFPQSNRSPPKGPSRQNGPAPKICPWLGMREAKFKLKNVPIDWGTQRVHAEVYHLGKVTYIDINREKRLVWVTFTPPPQDRTAIETGISITQEQNISRGPDKITFEYDPPTRDKKKSIAGAKEDHVTLNASRIDFGVMKEKAEMLGLHTVQATPQQSIEFSVNKKRRRLEIHFSVPSSMITYDPKRIECKLPHQLRYQMQINFAQLSSIARMKNEKTGETALVLSLEAPPMVYWRSHTPKFTHDKDATRWTEWNLWFRQTEIEQDWEVAKHAVKQLQRDSPIIDIGRWLTYRLVFSRETIQSKDFEDLQRALEAHNIPLTDFRIVPSFAATKAMKMYSWLDSPVQALQSTTRKSSLSDLEQMAHETIQLPFPVRYALESCISHGCLHECNIDKEFLKKLAAMALENDHGKVRSVKILEKVVEEGHRFYNPHDIFKRIVPNMRNALKQWQQAASFVKVLTATITPTAIYFNAPSLEPSNRVVRQFRQHEDRFLRVRFTDERYKGKIQGREENQENEIFTRVKRTMVNGIKVGERVYEFLAFGNAQFRENGAYFFAPIGDLNAQKIRDWMGDFSNIKVVAKYCSRIGQSLSTTRASPYKTFKRINIPDIERNGYCFTDGVGKISVMLAKLISNNVGMLKSSSGSAGHDQPYASAFQFRMEGCKGVLVVDPTMGNELAVAVRPSQEKFPVLNNTGIEICRISQFTNASLNVQVILVLSALGVEDRVFTGMMRKMLQDLEVAMTSESKAMELLQKNIDQNQMTVQVAQMILDGFMEKKDPFMISCLRLWRAWSLKFLKEKQRIFVEDGAFVLGCIDETNTLEGHYSDKPEDLPEIFLQISDREKKGQYKVVEGICVLARNPSLHPGDVRVVRAVKCDKLMHIRDCVVLPQKGDRDLANMCSGGDLDGDDYMVLWDRDLLPKEWNHAPMDYQAPPPREAIGKILVDDITSFYVTHMKYNNVGRIAVLHRCWADKSDDGVKSEQCLKLAELHSKAVDYAKTGDPAELNKHKSLHLRERPHWNGGKTTWHSHKVIGQLYDMVKREDFVPAWDLPFDSRILDAYTLSNETLEAAKDVKEEYDEAIRRVMAKYGIRSEFEVWSTFVLEHADEFNDYKFGEKIGEEVFTLKERFQKACHERISGEEKEQRDWKFKGPFVAAMYTVTASEVSAALAKCKEMKVVGGEEVPVMRKSVETMPFMSFPWLFPTELGWIATKREGHGMSVPVRLGRMPGEVRRKRAEDAAKVKEMLGAVEEPKPLKEIVLHGEIGRETVKDESEQAVELDIWGEKVGGRSTTASKMSLAGKGSVPNDSAVSLAAQVPERDGSAASDGSSPAASLRKTSATEDLHSSFVVPDPDAKTESPSPPPSMDGDLLDFDFDHAEPSAPVSPPAQDGTPPPASNGVLDLDPEVLGNERAASGSLPARAAAPDLEDRGTQQSAGSNDDGESAEVSEEDEVETEEVVLDPPAATSAFDALEAMVGA